MNPDIIHALEIAAIVVAGTLTGSELAVAVFFHPRISRLEDAVHIQAAQTLAKGSRSNFHERENFNHALFALAFFSRRQDRELLGAISRGLNFNYEMRRSSAGRAADL
jgi:hypothetical protein